MLWGCSAPLEDQTTIDKQNFIMLGKISVGCGGGLVVSFLAFYSDDPSSNPAGYLNFLYKKTKILQKRGRGWPIFKKC